MSVELFSSDLGHIPTVVIDSREQIPLEFSRLPSVRGSLQSGDYSGLGIENVLAIERKSLDDLATSVTTERERFERELHRLRGFHFKRLLVIGKREDVEAHNYRSKATPKAILASLSAFECRYDIPIVFAADPTAAASLVESWIYYFARETLKRAQALLPAKARGTRIAASATAAGGERGCE